MKSILLVTALMAIPSLAADVWFVPTEQANQMYGSKPFNDKAFRAGDSFTRSEMALDAIKQKKYVGEKVGAVVEALGRSDGFFDAKGVPSYLLSSDAKNIYQLVFLTGKGDAVEQVRIHRRSCEPPLNVMTAKPGPKKLAMELTGEGAKAIYDKMASIELENGWRKGESVKCGKVNKDYKCYFAVDNDGVIEAQ